MAHSCPECGAECDCDEYEQEDADGYWGDCWHECFVEDADCEIAKLIGEK